MNIEQDLIVIAGKSRYELEVRKAYDNEEFASRRYVKQDAWEKIRQIHNTQKANIAKIRKELGNNLIAERDDLTDYLIKNKKIFVLAGGDDSFKYSAQKILEYARDYPNEKKYVIGVVLDSRNSLGGLLYFNTDLFLDFLPKLEKDDFSVEKWTTLEARINNGIGEIRPYTAIDSYFLGEKISYCMARNVSDSLPEKGSGIIIATGAGSGKGAWYYNIHMNCYHKEDIFGKEEEIARAIVRETPEIKKVYLRKGEILTFYSQNDDNGIICADGNFESEFRMGSKAEIWISNIKLNVIRKII